MTPLEEQLALLKGRYPGADATPLPSGAHLISIPNLPIAEGWNQSHITLLFVAPPGYPGAQPDCFWAEPPQMRLAQGQTPQGTSDTNPIPEVGVRGTWFSWHLQQWNPNHDNLITFVNVALRRFEQKQ